MPCAPSKLAWMALSSQTTEAARSREFALPWMPSPISQRRSEGGSHYCSIAVSAAVLTPSKPSPWARRPYCWDDPICGGWRSKESRGSAKCSATSWPTWTSRSPSAATRRLANSMHQHLSGQTHEGWRCMNRIDRLTAIILLLQRGRRTASEIAHRFEVSKRTAFRDIQALCEMGVPIVTEAGAHGGYTLMPDYSLAPLQLTLREALLLRLALGSVSYRSERGASRQTILPRRLYCAAGFWYCEVYSLERREVRTYRVDRFVEVSPAPAPDPIEPSRSELPYEHPSHPEVRIRLTARG